MNDIVFRGDNNQALTNSLLVAEKFEKQHKSVIRAIENLLQDIDSECSAKLRHMFAEYTEDIPQPNGGYKTARRFAMNRDGFNLLVMGFTGKKAIRFKLEFIEAFNVIEKAIKEGEFAKVAELEQRVCAIEQRTEMNNTLSLPEPLTPMSQRDTIRMLVNDCARKMNISQRDVWRKVYDNLYYRYHVSVRSYKKIRPDETTLEAAERHGQLPRIYTIISNMNAMFR